MMNYYHNTEGFTLIELLVVMSIVAVLTSIAVPQFKSYREKSYDTRARSDLRSVAIAEEAYFLESEKYLSCSNRECENLPGIAGLSEGVTLQITVTDIDFTGTSSHSRGSGRVFRWDSARGGMQN
ncbi:MAG: prepilin-type N-terminal cleavage/methylation domain-containing protein [Candidatus Dadabacteria bacterium]|nr:MAG: prepilin-type N-terminal cleavage/methylation domain-containing protein [Candidatus Dadabacteria bacterium]